MTSATCCSGLPERVVSTLRRSTSSAVATTASPATTRRAGRWASSREPISPKSAATRTFKPAWRRCTRTSKTSICGLGYLPRTRSTADMSASCAFHVIRGQFERLRDGDRYWYQMTFSPEEIAELESTTLADVIRRNTSDRDRDQRRRLPHQLRDNRRDGPSGATHAGQPPTTTDASNVRLLTLVARRRVLRKHFPSGWCFSHNAASVFRHTG